MSFCVLPFSVKLREDSLRVDSSVGITNSALTLVLLLLAWLVGGEASDFLLGFRKHD